jgi:hypothetical protein
LKIAFIIDKTQTFQLVASTLYESLSRGHDCTLYCNFLPEGLGELLSIEPKITEFTNLKWVNHPDKGYLVQKLSSNRDEYDAVIGINLFNGGWKRLYETDKEENYSFEYCWNEIYNQVSGFKSKTTLLCNSDHSKRIIGDLSSYPNIESTGSPWFEFLSSFANTGHQKKRITFLAPHNSLYIKHGHLPKSVEKVLSNLRKWCSDNEFDLILKSRKKYNRDFKNAVKFNEVVSDTDAMSHILLYATSDAVIHFCSSAINELAFLQTPYLCLAPDFQKQLHTDRIHAPGIQRLHDLYYDGEIFDGVHCDSLQSDEMETDTLIQKLEGLLSSEKDWKNFQNTYFPGNHTGSASRIIDRIEDNYARAQKSSNNEK